jgi:hypothetical protein
LAAGELGLCDTAKAEKSGWSRPASLWIGVAFDPQSAPKVDPA